MLLHKLDVVPYDNDLKKLARDCLRALPQTGKFADMIRADINRLIMLFGEVYNIPTDNMCKLVRTNCTKYKNICTMCKYISTRTLEINNLGTSLRDSKYELIRSVTTVILFADYLYNNDKPPSDDDQHDVIARQKNTDIYALRDQHIVDARKKDQDVLLRGLRTLRSCDKDVYISIHNVEFPKSINYDRDDAYHQVDTYFVRCIDRFVQYNNAKFVEFLIQR